ncbi:MAG: protein-disulfide reductase DsbD, partial [Candidatus Ruthia sp.]|nr:protein-disulfide reductase DsbD [Candidatus Ruthturnera sp.]
NIHGPSLVDNALNILSKAKTKVGSVVEKVITVSDEPLPADEAFAFSVIAIDANTLMASWNIHPEYYLYHDKFFIETKGAEIGEVVFPKGKEKDDPLFGKVQIHKGQLNVEIPLENIQSTPITFVAKYQGCWLGGICYPPMEKVTDVILPVQGENTNTPPIQSVQDIANISSTPATVLNKTKNVELNETDKITNILKQGDVLWTLGWFFVIGLGLSLTPCVFPMIPILSGIIVGQKGVTTRKALIMSIVFVLAMSVTYTIAGVLAGLFGENLQILFQTPWVLIVFSLVFVALAFSMFGYYEIQLPARLQNKIANISNKQEGGHLIGVAIMGFLSALIVGPCVAPPLAGALIYIGQTGDAVLGGLSLFVMSLGMGAPLLAIGAGASKLPKAGGWMDNVKYVFGILMLAVAIWLLDRITSPIVSLALWATLFSFSPIAMGVLNSLTNTPTPWQRIFKAIGLLVLAYGILLWGLVARGGGDMLAPLAGYGNGAQVEQVHVKFEKIKSNKDLDQALLRAKANNQIVMLDFYADWCISCKELERFVFSNANVVNKMQNVIALQADVTANDATDKALMTRFNIIGPPAILFFKNGIENRPQRIVGEINAQGFLEHLKKSQ